jgi:hypothetical protein
LDREFLEGFRAARLFDVGQEQNEILVEERLELGVVVKLLTQQSAVPSATAEEVDEDELSLALGLGRGLVQRPLEPVLGRGGRGERQDGQNRERFFHFFPSIF